MAAIGCGIQNTQCFLMPVPEGTRFKGKLVQRISVMSHIYVRRDSDRVLLTPHLDNCASCLNPVSGGKCTGSCAADAYLFKNKILNELSGKWIYRTTDWTDETYDTDDGTDGSASDAE